MKNTLCGLFLQKFNLSEFLTMKNRTGQDHISNTADDIYVVIQSINEENPPRTFDNLFWITLGASEFVNLLHDMDNKLKTVELETEKNDSLPYTYTGFFFGVRC